MLQLDLLTNAVQVIQHPDKIRIRSGSNATDPSPRVPSQLPASITLYEASFCITSSRPRNIAADYLRWRLDRLRRCSRGSAGLILRQTCNDSRCRGNWLFEEPARLASEAQRRQWYHAWCQASNSFSLSDTTAGDQ